MESVPRTDVFACPVCGYRGPFEEIHRQSGSRKHARCPGCGALERHRLQYLVLHTVLENIDTTRLELLHVAPERFFRKVLSERFRRYETADLFKEDVDYRIDLQNMPFPDESYDFVFASHVLEHIPDDRKAMGEIRRILRSGGIAVLPVPVVAEKTVEYPAANPNDSFHVRAPGFDYFDRYRPFFSRVELFHSDSFPKEHQLFVYEDRSHWPTEECPLRPSMDGERHEDFVPVCYV
jgi:SAM-dependent methyltransferase